jgi:hypothetical protein
MSRQDPTSRAKPKPEGDEEATSVLNLGEFQNVDALSLSEASIIINAVLAKRKKEGRNMKQNEYVWHSLSASERLPCERRDRLTRRKIAYYPNLSHTLIPLRVSRRRKTLKRLNVCLTVIQSWPSLRRRNWVHMLSFDPAYCLVTYTNTEQARFAVEKPTKQRLLFPPLRTKLVTMISKNFLMRYQSSCPIRDSTSPVLAMY